MTLYLSNCKITVRRKEPADSSWRELLTLARGNIQQGSNGGNGIFSWFPTAPTENDGEKGVRYNIFIGGWDENPNVFFDEGDLIIVSGTKALDGTYKVSAAPANVEAYGLDYVKVQVIRLSTSKTVYRPSDYVIDNFDRVNPTSLLQTDTGQSWGVTGGPFGRFGTNGYKAYLSSVGSVTTPIVALVNANQSDNVIVRAQISISGNNLGSVADPNPAYPGLVFRAVDGNNYLYVKRWLNNSLVFGKVVAGVDTVRTTLDDDTFPSEINSSAGVQLRVMITGVQVTIYVNDTLVINDVGVTDFQNATRYGLIAWLDANTNSRWDNFRVERLQTAIPSSGGNSGSNGDGAIVIGGGQGFGEATYTYQQVTGSTRWIVTHNLKKYPTVQVVDNAEKTIVGLVTYISPDELQIDFNSAETGKAYLN